MNSLYCKRLAACVCINTSFPVSTPRLTGFQKTNNNYNNKASIQLNNLTTTTANDDTNKLLGRVCDLLESLVEKAHEGQQCCKI